MTTMQIIIPALQAHAGSIRPRAAGGVSAVIVLAMLLALAGCGGMNRAVGVLPATLDDLAQKSAPLRGEPVL